MNKNKSTESQSEENINSAKVGEVDIDTLIVNATLLCSIYQMPTGQIIWKSLMNSDEELGRVLNLASSEVHNHNIIKESVAASLKAVEDNYGSGLLGPDGKPALNV